MEFETFYGKIRTSGGISLEITIPQKLCSFAGIKVGDKVKVMIQKSEVIKDVDGNNENE